MSLAVVSASLGAALSARQYLFDLPYEPQLTRDHQYWRLVSHHLAFNNSSELLLAVLLFFTASVPVERLYGSTKYASFLLVTTTVSSLFELLLLRLAHPLVPSIPAGPFSLVCCIIYQANRMVPTTFHWALFGLPLTGKVSLYTLAFFFATSQPSTTPLLAFIGLLSSHLYHLNFLSLANYIIPPRVSLFFSSLFQPIYTVPPRRGGEVYIGEGMSGIGASLLGGGSLTARRRAELLVAGVGNGVLQNRLNPHTTPQTIPQTIPQQPSTLAPLLQAFRAQPSQAQIAELQSMFPDLPRERIIQTLQDSQFDNARAIDSLLTAGP